VRTLFQGPVIQRVTVGLEQLVVRDTLIRIEPEGGLELARLSSQIVE